MQQNRGRDWLSQAENDLRCATAALRDAFFSQVCFICQQSASKSLKAVCYAHWARVVLTHSLVKLCQDLQLNGELLEAAKILDQYYISARYPDALAAGAPHDVFTAKQAKEALEYATLIFSRSSSLVAEALP